MEIKKITRKILPALLGLFAGVLSGMLGAGGGIVIALLLPVLYPDRFGNAKDLFANTLCILLPLSAVTAIGYAVDGFIDLAGVSRLMPPSILGGLFGGFLTLNVNSSVLRAVFGILTLWSGVYLIFR